MFSEMEVEAEDWLWGASNWAWESAAQSVVVASTSGAAVPSPEARQQQQQGPPAPLGRAERLALQLLNWFMMLPKVPGVEEGVWHDLGSTSYEEEEDEGRTEPPAPTPPPAPRPGVGDRDSLLARFLRWLPRVVVAEDGGQWDARPVVGAPEEDGGVVGRGPSRPAPTPTALSSGEDGLGPTSLWGYLVNFPY